MHPQHQAPAYQQQQQQQQHYHQQARGLGPGSGSGSGEWDGAAVHQGAEHAPHLHHQHLMQQQQQQQQQMLMQQAQQEQALLDPMAGAPPCPPQPDLTLCAERERAYSESLFRLRCALDGLGAAEARLAALSAAQGLGSSSSSSSSSSSRASALEKQLTSP